MKAKVKAMVMIDLSAAVRGEKDEAGQDIESQARPLEAEAETYELARDAVFESVPEGWMIIGGIGVLPHRADTYRQPQ